MTYCYFGHHKCATTWFASVIPAVCQDLGLSWTTTSSAADFNFGSADAQQDFLMFRNAGPNHVPQDREYRGFHMIRDPRDIVVSAVHSHRSSHPTEMWENLKDMREKLKLMSLEEALLWELDHLRPIFQQMGTWNYANPSVRELRMEDLIANPYRTVLQAFHGLGLLEEDPLRSGQRIRFALASALNKVGRPVRDQGPRGWLNRKRIPAERLLGIAFALDFKRLSGGREQGQENVNSHFRKGVAGDWKGTFTPRVIARFKELYSDLLIRLGYERDADW